MGDCSLHFKTIFLMYKYIYVSSERSMPCAVENNHNLSANQRTTMNRLGRKLSGRVKSELPSPKKKNLCISDELLVPSSRLSYKNEYLVHCVREDGL